MTSKNKIFEISGEIAIYRRGELFFGMSQFLLLKSILSEGSINAAAKSRKISYQQAWSIVDRMNKLSLVPLVIRQKGGVQGGGCRVTSYGKSLLSFYEKKVKVFYESLNVLNDDLDLLLF